MVTCQDEKDDGSCESVLIPSCADRTVRCSSYPNPNGVQTDEKNGCAECPAKLTTPGVVPDSSDYRVLNTELQ